MVAPSWITTDPDPVRLPSRLRPGWAPKPNKSVRLVRGWDVPEGLGAGQEFVDEAGNPRSFYADTAPGYATSTPDRAEFSTSPTTEPPALHVPIPEAARAYLPSLTDRLTGIRPNKS